MWDFLQNYWAYIALGISEALAFVPSKYSGIAQAALKILSAIFTKKTDTSSKSATQSVNINQNF
jgi:hypothetical protein